MSKRQRITTIDDCLLFFETPDLPTDTKELRFVYGLGRQLAAEVRRLRDKNAMLVEDLRQAAKAGKR